MEIFIIQSLFENSCFQFSDYVWSVVSDKFRKMVEKIRIKHALSQTGGQGVRRLISGPRGRITMNHKLLHV